MTAQQFESILDAIRARQGTRHPLVQVSTSDRTIRGRVGDFVVDRGERRPTCSPYGILTIEQPGLVPGPMQLVQVAEILEDGVHELADRRPALVGASA